MKSNCLILAIFTIPVIALAQPEVRWERTYGGDSFEFPAAITRTVDGGFLLAGSTWSFGPNHDQYMNAYAIRTDREGEMLWSRVVGGDREEEFRGVTTGQGDCSVFEGRTSSHEILCVKYDSEGEEIWSNIYERGVLTMGYAPISTEDGGFLLGGIIALGGGRLEYGLFKIDTDGREEWVRQYGEVWGSNTFGLCNTLDGGFAVSGQHQWVVEWRLHSELWALKTNAQGGIIWQHFYGESPDYTPCMIQTADSGYAMGGFHRENDITTSMLIKLDPRGRREWQRLYRGNGDNSWICGMLQTIDGGYLLGCSTEGENDRDQGDILLIRLDADGEEIWRETYATEETNRLAGIVECEDFGFAILGSRYVGNNNSDFWLIRTETDPTGNHPPRWLDRPIEEYDVTIGERLQASLRAVDYDGDEVQISLLAENLPEALTIEVLDGEGIDIDFATDGMEPAEYSFQAVASDGEFNDTLSITIQLLNPAMSASLEVIDAESPVGDPITIPFQLINNTEDTLRWHGSARLPGEVGDYAAWDLRTSIALDSVNDESVAIRAVCFAEGNYYLAVSSEAERYIVGLNRQGEVVSVIPQLGLSETGFTDLDWDGENFWGVEGESVWIFGFDGDLVGLFDGPFEQNQAIAYDRQRNLVWVSGVSTDIVGFDSGGNEVARIDRQGLHIYGLACWQDDPDGMNLYILDNPGNDQQLLYKVNPDEGEVRFMRELQQQGRAAPGGAFIATDYDNGETAVFMNAATGQVQTLVNVWHLFSNTGWMRLDAESGSIDPAAEVEVNLTLLTQELREEAYHGVISFEHDGRGEGVKIPVNLQVVPNSVASDQAQPFPQQFGLTVSPNPFNGMVGIGYSVPVAESLVKLTIYDAAGREVAVVSNGRHDMGSYKAVWDGSAASTGIYFLKMDTPNFQQTIKLVLAK